MLMNNTTPGKKPFPWSCTNCQEQAVYAATIDYVAKRRHDGREYTVKIDGLKTPKCTNCGQVMLDSEALETITAELVRQLNLLTPTQIRIHRLKANLTPAELAAALGVSDETIARWEDGVQIQSRGMDNLLRLFFGLQQVREILTTHQIGQFPALGAIPFVDNKNP
jgi:putative zinc finger/helix-turn-helix YgiT family protein